MTHSPTQPTAPNTHPIISQGIPPELNELDQWVAWRWERRDGTWTKPPLNPATGRYARNNAPDTWGSFEAALQRMREDHLPGIGFMFHPDDLFAGVDLDKCRDPVTGEIDLWALEIVEELDSYTEVSPSETGLKVFIRGNLPSGRRRKGSIEMYDRGRFFTTTGHRLFGAPSSLRDCQEELTTLHRRVFGEPTDQVTISKKGDCESTTHGLSDDEFVNRAMQAANGEKFTKLWAGDTNDYRTAGNEGRSEADLALCSLLAFWTGPDEDRINGLFRQSGLMRPKWDERHYGDGRTYGQGTIQHALAGRSEFWSREGATPSSFSVGKSKARRLRSRRVM